MNQKFEIRPIGIIHTPFANKAECPIQGKLSSADGTIEVYPKFQKGLETIKSFTHIYLFYIFDRSGEIILSRPTFLDDSEHGVFASRHPCRPNGIGMSIVKLKRQIGNKLQVSGIDVLDKTPLIDIKPYIPRFDHFEAAGNGWVAGVSNRRKPKNLE